MESTSNDQDLDADSDDDDDDVACDDVNGTEESGVKSTRQGATIRPRPHILHCSYSYVLFYCS